MDESAQKLNPLEYIFLSGIVALDKFTFDNAEANPLDRLKAFKEGVAEGVRKVGMGLYALPPREEKWLATIATAQKEIESTGQKDKLALKLTIVEKQGEKVLLDPTGKPANLQGGIIKLSK